MTLRISVTFYSHVSFLLTLLVFPFARLIFFFFFSSFFLLLSSVLLICLSVIFAYFFLPSFFFVCLLYRFSLLSLFVCYYFDLNIFLCSDAYLFSCHCTCFYFALYLSFLGNILMKFTVTILGFVSLSLSPCLICMIFLPGMWKCYFPDEDKILVFFRVFFSLFPSFSIATYRIMWEVAEWRGFYECSYAMWECVLLE